MKINNKLPDVSGICKKANISNRQVKNFLSLIKRSMKPFSKHLSVIENGVSRDYKVERRGLGIIQTKYGEFWQYNFFINDKWKKYSVIVKAELNEKLLIPIFKNKNQLALRTDSGCETGQVFGDLTCDCHDQLNLTLDTIEKIGEGMLINIPHQDGRGMGLTFKLATLWTQKILGIDTVESATLLTPGDTIDARTYSGIICILKFFNISKTCHINLVTNNPEKAKVFLENGYKMTDYIPVVIRPNGHTEAHLRAKQNYFGHKGLIKTKKRK